ncbi:hypothetical protein [Gimesia aquarii]|uniref:hypothetical protein n=1 Tax=Gimesia aquarii TaxID=2527964 RepID=UPI0011A8905F|nr:hypothetical protein [Gimesia aquarii]
MGWKSTLRSIESGVRRIERESRKHQRELEKQRQQIEKMQELERAQYEVELYENYVELLLSVHKECGPIWDWEKLRSAESPLKPKRSNANQNAAQAKLYRFKPTVLDKVFKRNKKKRAALELAVEVAKKTDVREYKKALKAYENEFANWKAICKLAEDVLAGNTKAYIESIHKTNPFNDITELGSSIKFHAKSSSCIEAILCVKSEEIIPTETKSLLKSGKVSIKKMPVTKYYELYQDYVCGCILRVARELFALLPVEFVIVTAVADLLNTQTGHMDEQPISSVGIPRVTFEKLNFDMLDPSDSMGNFLHKMNFQKTKGFKAVDKISLTEIQKS